MTADFVNEHLSELGSGCEGRDEYRRRLAGFLSTFVGARYTIVALAETSSPDDNDVIVRYRFEATYEATPIDIPGIMWFTVRDGLIAQPHRPVGLAHVPPPNRSGRLSRLDRRTSRDPDVRSTADRPCA